VFFETVAFVVRLIIFHDLLQRCIGVNYGIEPELDKLFSGFEKGRADDVIFFELLVTIMLNVRSEIVETSVSSFAW